MAHHLILTQSSPPSLKDAQTFNEMGFSTTHAPALSITYTQDPLNCPFTPETLIVTSKHSLHNIENYNLPKNIQILCVGESTKEKLFEKNIKNLVKVFETGTHLIEELKKHASVYNNILYLRGKDVQHDINSTCNSLSLNIHEHLSYYSKENSDLQKKLQDTFDKNKCTTISVFSEKGAKAIAKVMPKAQHTPQERRTNLLCLSQRMLNSLKQLEWNQTFVCTHPTKQDFLLKLNDLKDTEKDL